MSRLSKGLSRWLTLTILLMSGAVSHAQSGGSLTGQVIQPAPPAGTGGPASLAQVRVCPFTGVGSPCSPLSNLFSDPFLTSPVSNPFTTDSNGNYSLFVTPGYYLVQVTASAGTIYQYLYNVPTNTTLVSTSFPGADRCAAILTAINTIVNGVSGDPVDARPEIAVSIPCNSNMLPSSITGTVNSSANGGDLAWPAGQFNVAVGQQLALNGFHVHGIGLGLFGGTGITILVPTAGFSFGSGSAYNPAVFAMGGTAGQIANGLGPFSSEADHFKVDCNPAVAPAGIMGITYFSGQEDTMVDYFGIDHCPTTSLSIGGGSNSTGNGGKIQNFYIQHSGNLAASCPVPTAHNVTGWTYTAGAHRVVVTASGGSPVPQLGHGAVIAGLAAGAAGVQPNHPAAHVCAIGTVSDDLQCQGLTLGANQFAYLYNGGATNDSSAAASGTVTLYPVGVRDEGIGGRSLADGSIVAQGCAANATPISGLDINVTTPLLVENVHLEEAQMGITLATESSANNIMLNDIHGSTVSGPEDLVHIFAQAGFLAAPVNILNANAKLGTTNAIIDENSSITLTHNVNSQIGFYFSDALGYGIVTNAIPEPGLTNAFDFNSDNFTVFGGAIASSTLNFGGSNYNPGDVFQIAGQSGGNNAIGVVDTVSGGVVATYHIFYPGSGYNITYQGGAATPAAHLGPVSTGHISGTGGGLLLNITGVTAIPAVTISQMGMTTEIASAISMTVTNTINSGLIVKVDSSTGNALKVTTGDTGAGIPIGVTGPGGSFGSGTKASIVTSGIVWMLNEVGGGSCSIGNWVVVSSAQAGAPHCTNSFTPGTVVGVALSAATSGQPLTVMVGLR